MNYSKISDNLHLYRDNLSGAIINSNTNEYENYLQQKRIKERENNKIAELEKDIHNIKNDLSEIKRLLGDLLNGSR